MFKCVKIHDSRVRALVGSTNREKREVDEADTPSADGVNNGNSGAIWSICTYSCTHAWFMLYHASAEVYFAS